MRFLIAATAIMLTVTSAFAQTPPTNASTGIGQHVAHARDMDKSDPKKPKVDDKAYNAALRNLPDKHYDPWHGVR